jgi:hypothetical protein
MWIWICGSFNSMDNIIAVSFIGGENQNTGENH